MCNDFIDGWCGHMGKTKTIHCADCGCKVVLTEEYFDCTKCASCALEHNDRVRSEFNGQRAMETFYRLKDEGVF